MRHPNSSATSVCGPPARRAATDSKTESEGHPEGFIALSVRQQLLGRLAGFEDWLRFGSANFLYFVREPGDVELGSDPRCDF